MKYIKLSIIGLCIILVSHGCSASKGHPGVGFVPKIINATMSNIDDTVTTFTFGDQVTFNVEAEDEDLNMKTLWVTEIPAAAEETSSGPFRIVLPAQSSVSMTYTELGPITLSGSAGTYTMDLQIEDASGNKTDVYTISYTLE